jgi:hypothetical protein
MAKIVVSQQVSRFRSGPCFDLDGLVGRAGGSNNHPDDVMLVQFLLRHALKMSTTPLPLGPPLAMDGLYGPATHYWTLYFMLSFQGHSCFTDVRVDPWGIFCPLGNGRDSFLLLALNYVCDVFDRGPDVYLSSPGFPHLLKQKLQPGRARGPGFAQPAL